MKLGMYSVYDKVMGVFLAPFPARNDVEAGRQIKAAMTDPNLKHADMVMSPRDFELHHVCDFNDENGEVSRQECSRLVSPLSAFSTVSP